MAGFRSSRSDSAARGHSSLVRATIKKVNDKPKMQEVDIDLMHDEDKTDVERWQHYGFSAVPHPPSGNERAEAIVAFTGGHRSHGAVIAVDDRRHRPKNQQPGESMLYDDQGQQVQISRGGIKLNGGGSKKPMTFTVGNATVKIEDGKVTASVGSMKIIVSASRVDLGGEGGSGVLTEAGTSAKVFAIL
jgi:phage baseplate assembly protein V